MFSATCSISGSPAAVLGRGSEAARTRPRRERRSGGRPGPVNRRLDYLDTVRALAAISVVASHYVQAYGLPRWKWALTDTPLHIWWDGYAAVSLFFVLSGFVLSLKYFRNDSEPPLKGFRFVDYLVARCCRIWLPYLVVLGLSAALWRFSAQDLATDPRPSRWFSTLWPAAPTWASLARQAILIKPETVFAFVPQAWTLAVELVLSFLVPLGVLVASNRGRWLLFCAFVAAQFAGMSPFIVHFALGIVLARSFSTWKGWLESRVKVRLAMFFIGWLLYSWRYLFVQTSILHPRNFDWYISGIGAAGLLMLVAASPRVRSVFSSAIPRHLGRVSYSLYLSHFLVLFCLTPRILVVLDQWAPSAAWSVGLAATIAASFAISEPVYRAVEVPTIALGRWLVRMMGSRRERASLFVTRDTPSEALGQVVATVET